MINLKKFDIFKIKYFTTFFTAFCLAVVVVTGIIINARLSIEDQLYITKEHKSEFYKKFTASILSQQEFLEKMYSDDYKFNIYLAGLYQTIENFEKAEFYYKRAIQLAPDATYEHYLKLIILYLEYHKPKQAEEIEESIKNRNSQRLIRFKCSANLLLADYYYRHNEPLLANKKYNIAEYFFNKLKIRKVKIREYITNGILASNVKIADNYVEQNNYYEAYRYLKRAEKAAPGDLTVKYKIALVLSYIQPVKAIEYFEFIKAKEPQLVSFYLYYETLMRAADICRTRGDLPSSKLYTYKAGSIKNFYQNNIINNDNIEFDFLQSKIQTAKKNDKFILRFRVKNISSFNISNMKMDILIYRKGHLSASYTKTFFDKTPLKQNETSPIITVIHTGSKHYKKIAYPDISFEIYVYKNEKYKTLVYKGDFGESIVTEF